MTEITLYQLLDLMESGENDTQVHEVKADVISQGGCKYHAHAYWEEQKLIIELEIY